MNESDPLLHQLTPHENAAWIVDETTRGFSIHNLAAIPSTRTKRDAYLFFENTHYLRQLIVIALVLLSFFELPSYCSHQRVCLAPNNSDLSLSTLPYLSAHVQAFVNICLLAILVSCFVYDVVRLPNASLHPYPRFLFALFAALALDALWVASFHGYPPFRIAPFLRALLPLFYFHALRECTFSIVAVLNPFLDVVTILTLFTLTFGWIVTLAFHDIPKATNYFGNLSLGLYSTFTSITTADWPMQVMAVLDVSRASALLFLAFIVIGVFLLLNILLAVVYNAYTKHIEQLVIDQLRARRHSLGLAYDALTQHSGVVSLEDVKLLFDELRKNKKHGHIDDQRVQLLFTAMDSDGDDTINRDEFLGIVDALQFEFILEMENISPMEHFFPSFYISPLWQRVATFVRSNSFSYVINFIMVVNIAIVVLESTLDLREQDTVQSVLIFATIEIGFSFVYIVEMVLKVASQGFDRYWRDYGNRFDFAVTWLLLAGAMYVLYPYTENDRSVVRYLVLLRCLRLFALLVDVPRFRKIMMVFNMLIPASAPLFSFLFLSLYVFAAAGVELFGGLIYKSNPALNVANNASVGAYVGNDYWDLNFNDMASGWYTLFSAVIVSYLTEIAEAIASTSRFGEWTKWFFIINFVVNSLIVSNCVLALVVDLFIMAEEDGDSAVVLAGVQSRYGSKRIKVLQTYSSAEEVYRAMFKERVEEMLTNTDRAAS